VRLRQEMSIQRSCQITVNTTREQYGVSLSMHTSEIPGQEPSVCADTVPDARRVTSVLKERYGSIGKAVHVHHLQPVATLRRASRLDPVKALVPVYPNCHAMLHTSEPSLSIEELRKILTKSAAPKS